MIERLSDLKIEHQGNGRNTKPKVIVDYLTEKRGRFIGLDELNFRVMEVTQSKFAEINSADLHAARGRLASDVAIYCLGSCNMLLLDQVYDQGQLIDINPELEQDPSVPEPIRNFHHFVANKAIIRSNTLAGPLISPAQEPVLDLLIQRFGNIADKEDLIHQMRRQRGDANIFDKSAHFWEADLALLRVHIYGLRSIAQFFNGLEGTQVKIAAIRNKGYKLQT